MISATTVSASFTGNGSTTAFATGFKFAAAADLVVTVAGVAKALTTDYTVAGAGDDAGGTVTFVSAPDNAAAIVISRSTPVTQPVSFIGQGSYAVKTHEGALDRLTMQVQELAANTGNGQTGGSIAPEANVTIGTAGLTDIRRSATGTVTVKAEFVIGGSISANAFVGTINETWARPVSAPWSGAARLVHGGSSSLVPAAISNTDGAILIYASLVSGDVVYIDAVFAGQ